MLKIPQWREIIKLPKPTMVDSEEKTTARPVLCGCKLGHGSIEAGLAHFILSDDRQCRLLLDRLHPAVPALRLVVEGIQNGRRIALTDAAVDTDRDRPPVSERARRIMAGTASHASVGGQPTAEEEVHAEGNFSGVCGLSGGSAARLLLASALFSRMVRSTCGAPSAKAWNQVRPRLDSGVIAFMASLVSATFGAAHDRPKAPSDQSAPSGACSHQLPTTIRERTQCPLR
jgi:hypothetical protein